MTKNIIIALGLLMMIAFTSTVWAETVTIDGSNSGGTDLVFTTSPNTTMNTATTATAFYIAAASTRTTTSNGIEYAMTSANGFIYQKAQATAGACTAAGTAGAVPSGYTVKGGT
ncbi:MAG: hypothetical protein HOG03_12970 [Desulfobacula sp.]|jgi:hypothetical protein|uniref:hypothetical protein n=1 Tax=Desulfobacula sp. TaxID=2593537 RepID=UPI001D1C8007|nr:hypothetical protein [Desulfobacula sp.]MBT3485888.1 hypothetical protein [Desulfobacula sp.]MBT3805491.1 hypothetical protein [Desulfobacula sp.]MBT4026794.1 hypothetical protein [Desulfobacula sp.]MBT4199602.1 hypothetical protein [Desulfobacula sp.]